jgi:hypothetical protein
MELMRQPCVVPCITNSGIFTFATTREGEEAWGMQGDSAERDHIMK